jgi:hypothetical protein
LKSQPFEENALLLPIKKRKQTVKEMRTPNNKRKAINNK